MKTIKLTLTSLVAASSLFGASINVQNINNAGNAAYGLFDKDGTLVSGSLTDNLKVGYFADGFNADAAWASGNIAALNANFTTYGSEFGMFGPGFDGAFQGAPNTTSTPFVGKQITLWATDGGSQHLIYTFSSLTFEAEPWTGGAVLLGTDAGDFINAGGVAAGGYGNYSHDFALGGGALDGFNTVSAVPEPSTFAALAGLCALGAVIVRRRRA